MTNATATTKVRRGDLVMVELRSSYTVGNSYKRVEELEFKLMTVTNLTRDGKIRMVRDERWSSDGAPVKFDGMLYATGNWYLLPASDWNTAKAIELAKAHTYPNSDTPRAFPSLEAARDALTPARRDYVAPAVADEPAQEEATPTTSAAAEGTRFCGACGDVFDTTAALDAHQLETGHEMDQEDHPLRRARPAVRQARDCAGCAHGLNDIVGYVVAYSHLGDSEVTFTDIAYLEGDTQYGRALSLVREARAKVATGSVDATYAVVHTVYQGGHRPA